MFSGEKRKKKKKDGKFSERSMIAISCLGHAGSTHKG